MRIVYGTILKRCPDCNKILKAYRTEIRHIVSIDNGIFTAVHRIRRCRKCMKLFVLFISILDKSRKEL